MPDKIISPVQFGGRTFGPGQEDELKQAVKDSKVDLDSDHLARSGAVSGFGSREDVERSDPTLAAATDIARERDEDTRKQAAKAAKKAGLPNKSELSDRLAGIADVGEVTRLMEADDRPAMKGVYHARITELSAGSTPSPEQ